MSGGEGLWKVYKDHKFKEIRPKETTAPSWAIPHYLYRTQVPFMTRRSPTTPLLIVRWILGIAQLDGLSPVGAKDLYT